MVVATMTPRSRLSTGCPSEMCLVPRASHTAVHIQHRTMREVEDVQLPRITAP